VLVALGSAVVLLAAFAVVDRRAREPILPFDSLRNPIVASSIACMALVGMAMFGTISYVPLFVQGVIGTSATSSGVVLTPLMLGAVVTSFLSGQLVSRTGRYRWNVVLGPPVLAVGMYLLSRMNAETTNGEAARNMVIAGIGLGSMMQVFVLSVQNAVPRARIGAATALTQFSRQMGATIGVTVMGAIVNHGLPAKSHGAELTVLHRLPPALRVVAFPRPASGVRRRDDRGGPGLADRAARREGGPAAPVARRHRPDRGRRRGSRSRRGVSKIRV